MTKQEFIDKWSSNDMSFGFEADLEELLNEQADIEYQRGFQKGWKEGKENCNDLMMKG